MQPDEPGDLFLKPKFYKHHLSSAALSATGATASNDDVVEGVVPEDGSVSVMLDDKKPVEKAKSRKRGRQSMSASNTDLGALESSET